MAKENIAFMVNLRKNTVPDSDMFGRYYPEAESKETLSTKGFAKHVSDHGGTLVSYELMQMVLAGIVKCLKEYMSQGQPVKLDGLGTFRPTVTSVTGGAASIEEALQKGVNNMVAGVNFVFIPENAQGEEITSKKFKDQCSLQFAYLVETIKKVIGGKEKSYTLRTPLSAWGIAQADDEGGDGGNGGGSDTGGSSNGGSSTGGSSQSGSQGGNGGSTNSGGNTNSGSNTGGNTSGNQSGSGEGEPGNYKLLIYKYGSGTSTITDDSEQEINSGASIASGSTVNISVVPAEGVVPSARLDYTNFLTLTENDGVYTGSFQMPAKGTMLEVNSEPGDTWYDTGD
jgi:hypothetical protein